MIGVLVGALALLVAYYWVHKPLDPALLLALGGALLDLLTAAALFAVAGGLGRRALSCLDVSRLSRSERVALESGLGLGLIASTAALLGMAGLFRGVVLWPLLALAALLAGRDLRAWARDVGTLIRSLRPPTPWARFLAVVTGLLLLAALLYALAPPIAWDALTYHLVGPQRYLAAGRIAPQPDNHFLGFPQLVEVLFGVAMSLWGRDTAAAPIHAGFGGLALLAMGGLSGRHAGPAARWLSVILPLSSFSVWLLFGRPYVDLAAMAYGALALVALAAWREGRSSGWLGLLGVCLGLALGVKYTAGGLALAALIAVAVREPRRAVCHGAILAGAAGLAFLPWLLKGWLLYGNPVYPFLFGGLNWDAVRGQTFSGLGTGLLGTADAWQLPILPLAATVFGVERGGGYAFTAGPWLLTAPLLLLPGWRWLDGRARALAADCLLIGLPVLGCWVILAASSEMGEQTRLMAVAWPAAAIAGALGFQALADGPRQPLRLHFVMQAVLAVTLLFGLAEPLGEVVRARPVDYWLGRLTRADFLAHNLGAYAGAMRQLAELPPGSTVRLMWEPRSYHCPVNVSCTPDILFDHWAYPLMGGQSPDEVFAAWRAAGDTHLLVFDQGLAFVLAYDPRFQSYDVQFATAVERWMTPIWTDGAAYTLYAWREPPPR